MSDKPAAKGEPGTAWNDPKVPGLRLRYGATKAVWYLYYRTRAGKQRNLKLGDERALSLTKAREIARSNLQRVAEGFDPADERNALADRPTMRHLYDDYMAEHVTVRNKSSYAKAVEGYWRRSILPHFGENTAVADVTEAHVAKLHHKMRATPSAANMCMSVLSKPFNIAEKWGWRPRNSNPVTIERFKEQKRKRVPAADEAVRLLIAIEAMRAERPHFIALVELLLFTGARLREIMHAEWEWVKPDGLHLPDSKTGAKVLPLSSLAREVLDSIPRVTDNPYIIIGRRRGAHLVNASKPWKELCKQAQITQRLTRHDLRRFFASAGLSQGGVTLDQIGGMLGHASASTTKRYAYLLTNSAQEHADATANAVRSIMTGGGKVVSINR